YPRFRRALYLSWAAAVAAMLGILWFAWRFPFKWDNWLATCQNAAARAVCLTVFLGLLLAAKNAVQLNLQRPLQVAAIIVAWLDFITHVPRQNPTVPRAALEAGLVRLSPKPGVGVSRAMISPAADWTFRQESVSEGRNRYVANRLGLF